jgi:hypothetical protein
MVLLQTGEGFERYGTVATPSAVAGMPADGSLAGGCRLEAIWRLVERFSCAPAAEYRAPSGGSPLPPLSPGARRCAFDLVTALPSDGAPLLEPGATAADSRPTWQAWRRANRLRAGSGSVSTRPGGQPGSVFRSGAARRRLHNGPDGAGGTPSAALVDSAGRIGAPLAVGAEAVLSLLAGLSPIEASMAGASHAPMTD